MSADNHGCKKAQQLHYELKIFNALMMGIQGVERLKNSSYFFILLS